MHRRILATVGVIALVLPATAVTAAAANTTDADAASLFDRSASSGQIDSSFEVAALSDDTRVNVVIEMEGDPVAVVEAEKGSELSAKEKSSVVDELQAAQESIEGGIVDAGGEVHTLMQSAYNGIKANLPAGELETVAELPGVVKIHAVETHTIDNSTSVPYLGVPEEWEATGYTGENIKVAIIDTGIDYTHATFGGPGTVEAYEEAFASSTEAANPAWYGPDAPRVKGGIDLVGDDYDAQSPETSTPEPDDNPLDCQGHGSHVAGTAAGSGVTADGATYEGPYDSNTPAESFLVGPGTAPQADLYAVRVFGCDGSTDVTVEAIDWAVENDMDVINMSLGSTYGTADDPSAVASTNAVGAGVVVITSAGNSGHNPYLTGAPGAGDGVIAVAATDGTESFPGAIVTVDGVDIEAINANGADLSGLGDLEVVRVTDDPATSENEALGCSAAAFTQAGVTEGGNQLAVVDRGTCARVAKAVFGQQAGAAVVLQINNADTLPPYEGIITENPDDGTPYDVTIPLLGVRLSDGAAFATGDTATVEATEIANPGFSGFGSFTSGGPRSGDSGISPNISAPGVSIASAAVGTGDQAAFLSGTSMAAPHVAGIAALAVEAHPGWTPQDIHAALVNTANPEDIAGYESRVGGTGLVDTKQALATQVTVTGDPFETTDGWLREAGLSFGFQESSLLYGGIKTVKVENHGSKAVTYKVSTVASEESLKAKVSTSTKSVTVRPGKSATFVVTASASPRDVPSSLAGDDQWSFYEISGDVVLTAKDSTLRVPYLLVPRSNSTVSTSVLGSLFSKKTKLTDTSKDVRLYNTFGALDATADVFTWGLSDPKDATSDVPDDGYDVRAAGVQSYNTEDGDLLVFAINTHKRFSNAASNEYQVLIDSDRDGETDWIAFSYDSGAVRAGSADGLAEVFLQNAETGALYAAGFLSQAPTDSSTVLLPLYADSVAVDGAFDYTVATQGRAGGVDTVDAVATYDASAPAISNGDSVTVKRWGSARVPLAIDADQVAAQNPLGAMFVVLDNRSGAEEALLVKLK